MIAVWLESTRALCGNMLGPRAALKNVEWRIFVSRDVR
jgi:hypothetical protein